MFQVSPIAVAVGSVTRFIAGGTIYGPLFGERWMAAMKEDKGTEKWKQQECCPKWNLAIELLTSILQAYVTGILLNVTRAQDYNEAAFLGLILFSGWVVPYAVSEQIWEGRPFLLAKLKFLKGFLDTVGLSVLMYAIGDNY
ncbi:4884_t:CDS:2 [Paraglomus brasilianum]|uniref:4884_t:CDS:1 n=1 Tax=Paraglomus brasilianum TaxID=144538 RepID=A0A9N9C7M2_9GLOM|nr:4884_t:CDS:2 [Paraglomus brasilianum]